MNGSKAHRAVSLVYGRAALLGLMAVAIVLCLGGICVFIPLGLVTRSDASIWVLIIPSVLYFLILNGGALGTLAWVVRRRKRWLDGLFTPLGLRGERYNLMGRQYQGTVEAREVTARFFQGPTLEVYLSTPLQTRLGVAEEGSTTLSLAHLAGREPVALEDPDMSGLHAFALDERWARALLTDPEARTLVRRLMSAGESWALVRQLILTPGALCLRLYQNRNLFKYDVTPEEAEDWLDDLLALARIAEGMPAPRVTAEESSGERLARTGGGGRIAVVVVALLVGVPTCLLALGAAAFFVWAIR